jgi:ribosome-associated protein
MIRTDSHVMIDERALQERFVHASGPGGQNVNKVATAVQLKFDVNRAALSAPVRDRLIGLAGRRITADGILTIIARRFRTQERNRHDARERLLALLLRAQTAPKRRRPTRPTAASMERRLTAKRHRSRTKTNRATVRETD